MATKTTTERGLGWEHQKNAERLLRNHIDGTPCWWCAEPMYRDAEQNFDGKTLNADHSVARAHGGTKADQLLHDKCNKARGKGDRDHLRPALTGMPVEDGATAEAALGTRVMPWP